DRYGFPGMKILQFGFGTESAHAPDQFRPNVVAYTGTHDNDTAVGWFEDPRPERASERKLALETLDSDGNGFAWDLIAAVLESVADTAIVPLQDVLGLGTQARMNTPATTEGNWRWRFRWSQLTDATIDRMRDLTVSAGR
ncbi:MAG: 4-alpha-glucanotransferase, partial [Acidimicrobiia bacterium]|nr:4-alpha-glucanotransferase [Acidimicrobiia bacterium]